MTEHAREHAMSEGRALQEEATANIEALRKEGQVSNRSVNGIEPFRAMVKHLAFTLSHMGSH